MHRKETSSTKLPVFRTGLAAAVLGLVVATMSGCGPQPNTSGVDRIDSADPERLEPNVVKIRTFWTQSPFGRVGGSTKPAGFVLAAMYLVTPTPNGGERGVFGDGIIHVYLYVLERGEDGKYSKRRLVREWLYDPEQAKPFRTKRPYVGGYGYQLHCAWGDVDLCGKRVEIEVHFERRDGQIVRAVPKQFIVPES